jgi:hypothetical protein
MKARQWLFLFLAALTVLRWIYGAITELSPDEAYYTLWSQRLDWAYFSKGPGVALAIRFGTALFGQTEFGVRFLSPLLALGTSLVMFFFARKMFSESVAVWTVILMNAIPIFQVGGMVMTIDPLSIFLWAAALFAFWLALDWSPQFSLWWPLTGLLIGLGFLSKYTNAMELLASSRKLRREFARPGFWSLLAVFAVCALPPLIWNQHHDWITMSHMKHRGGLDESDARNPIVEWFKFFGIHLGVYSPLIFAGMLAALWWSRDKARVSFRTQFLLCFSAPLLVMYFLLAFKKAGEPNWTAPAFVSLGILTAAVWHEAAAASRAKRIFAIAALTVGIVMSLSILNTDIFRAAGISWSYARDPGSRLRGWKSTAQLVDKTRKDFERDTKQPAFLIANTYGTAAELAFYLPEKRTEGPDHPPVYTPELVLPENQFFYWPHYDQIIVPPRPANAPLPTTSEEESAMAGTNPFLGRNALFVTDREDGHAPSAIKSGFERVELLAACDVRRRGQPLRSVRVFACYNYLNKNLLE